MLQLQRLNGCRLKRTLKAEKANQDAKLGQFREKKEGVKRVSTTTHWKVAGVRNPNGNMC